MRPELPEPGRSTDVPASFLAYLDFFRETVIAKVADLSDDALRASRLPSGWSPLELVKHLAFMERRWLRWGFLAEQVQDPWGDHADGDPDGPWSAGADDSLDDVVARLRRQGELTRRIVERSRLTDVAQVGGRFTEEQRAPTLVAILFHVTQEYARHAGHLDIARELLDGRVGE